MKSTQRNKTEKENPSGIRSSSIMTSRETRRLIKHYCPNKNQCDKNWERTIVPSALFRTANHGVVRRVVARVRCPSEQRALYGNILKKNKNTKWRKNSRDKINNIDRISKLTREFRSCLARCGWPSVAPDSSPAILKEQEVMEPSPETACVIAAADKHAKNLLTYHRFDGEILYGILNLLRK